MICPTCGAEAPESTVCPECGNVVAPVEQPDEYRPAGDGYWEVASLGAQPVEGLDAEQSVSESAGLEADDAATGATPDGNSVSEPDAQKAPVAAFALVIVGIVLSLLLVTCIPGIVCSVIGLVLNYKYSCKGFDNPRRMPTAILGVIGMVMGLVALFLCIAFGSMAKQIVDVANENGWDLNEIEVTQGSEGMIVVRKDSSSSAAVSPVGILESSSRSSSDDASASESPSASVSPDGDASGASAAAPGTAFIDELGNPTLHALVEFDGKQMQEFLSVHSFKWYDEVVAWLNSKNGMVVVINASGNVSRDQIEKLPEGANGSPVIIMLTAEGYATPQDALQRLGRDVAVNAQYEDEGALFAWVRNSAGADYLVVATSTGDSEQTLLIYTNEAIAQGLFRDTIGIDAGKTVTEIWSTITRQVVSNKGAPTV